MSTERWNHNIHYQRLVLEAAPAGCELALDVGCGEGMLVRELSRVSNHVVGIDSDSPSIELARRQPGEGIEYILDDFLTHPFEPESFDLVASVAALHHMDAEAGLARMARLVRPGGALVVIGLARSRRIRDFAFDVLGGFATRVHKYGLGKSYWEHTAPVVWPPPTDYAELERTARRVLPGVEYRRLVMWRYSLIWRRPQHA